MARHYYLTRSGRLRRKDNTLVFEPTAAADEPESAAAVVATAAFVGEVAEVPAESTEDALSSFIGGNVMEDGMGDLAFTEPEAVPEAVMDASAIAAEEERAIAEEQSAPVKVRERRTIPVEDVDALWVFGEMELNARVLVFLAQKKVPVHFFNYYGYYAGTFYPREYLHAGYLVVRQVRHYSNKRTRLFIAREFIGAALHNIMRNLRYYQTRGADLQAETESVQAEMLRLEQTKDVNELMSCEGRARAAYYKAFSRILRNDVDFTKRVRRPPDNIVNALISFTNGLVYSATL